MPKRPKQSDHAIRREVHPLDWFKPHPKNPRTHPPAQVALIADLMRRWGPDQDIVTDEHGVIIKGHGRLEAARLAGLSEYGATIHLGLSEEEKSAMRIADNQVSDLSGWDRSVLQAEIVRLQAVGFDIPILGFHDYQLRAFGVSLDLAGGADPDDAPEPPQRPVSAPGDVWILGGHRIVCGDSTAPAAVSAALGGERPHLMVTDPPYGVDYDAGWRNRVYRSNGKKVRGMAVGKVLNDDQADWREAWALFDGDVAYVWHAGLRSREVFESLEVSDFQMRAQIIWAKQTFPIGRGDYHFQHEPCWYAVRRGKTGHWSGDRKQTTLWQIPKPARSETGHSTQKPVECMKRPIENNSKVGDGVYEPFAGSGTTIIAAQMTQRRCFAIELNPAYVDVCVLRWQTFAGEVAFLEQTGQSFDEVRRARAAERRRKGTGCAKGDSGKPVSGKDARRGAPKRPVRQAVHDGRASTGGKPAGEPPALAADAQ